jgi:hypothetical protein
VCRLRGSLFFDRRYDSDPGCFGVIVAIYNGSPGCDAGPVGLLRCCVLSPVRTELLAADGCSHVGRGAVTTALEISWKKPTRGSAADPGVRPTTDCLTGNMGWRYLTVDPRDTLERYVFAAVGSSGDG